MRRAAHCPKVSILVPVYKREEMILETLESAASQTYKNVEIIVVDNKSPDDTYDIVAKFSESHPNVRAYQNETNIGAVRNWRKCLDYATGEYAKILFSDDLIAPSFIERTLPYLVKHEDTGFVFTAVRVFERDWRQETGLYSIGGTNTYDSRRFIESSLFNRGFPVSPGCALFRTTDLKKNLLIDVPNRLCIDLSIKGAGPDKLVFLLTAIDYPKFAFVDETLTFFRAHKDSITISSSKADVRALHHIASAYFLARHLKDDKMTRRLNWQILRFLYKYGDKQSYGIEKIEDFYPEDATISANVIPILYFTVKKWITSFLRMR